jgi:serine/threonine protein kinase
MELCAASLQDYIKGKYQGPMPTDEQVLFQLANGLEYIHSRKILYRGVTPQNILISLTKPVQMKYCDFALSKQVNKNGSRSLSGIRGTKSWMSPEELRMILNEVSAEDLGRGSVKSDIFSAGCVFIFFLLRGKHPFGDLETQKFTVVAKNIVKGDPINVKGS